MAGAQKHGDAERAHAGAGGSCHSFADEIRLFPAAASPASWVCDTEQPRPTPPRDGQSADGLGLMGLLPASLSSFSLLPAGKQQRSSLWLDSSGGQEVAQAHDWSEAAASAALCSVSMRNDDRFARSPPGSAASELATARAAAEQGEARSPSFLDLDFDDSSFDEQLSEFRVVRFDHCKPEAVGVGVYFEKMSAPECGVRVARLQPGGAADVEGSIAVGDVLVSVDDVDVAGIASMNDLARLVLGEEGTSVRLCMQHGQEGTGAGVGTRARTEGRSGADRKGAGRSGGGTRGKRDEVNGGDYEIILLRSRPQTTQAPPAKVRQGRYRQ
eukprot:Tamp_22152.p1 GENE.Tamp_22152~~Tamp_22152.p1  ORF type:complete len:359 (+),score=42.48 Tamp_22152:94-1077(+)